MKNRLPSRPNEWIDRNQVCTFRFEGQTHEGYAGDVLASALWANDIRFTGRSFKYHRPRGIYSMSGLDVNLLVEDRQSTNVRGDLMPLEDGLELRSVNTAGGLKYDWYRFSQWLSRFMPVGFYYKAFHTPRKLFPFYEKQLRQAAGLGKISAKWSVRSTPKEYAFCDVLVVGSGPSGLSAALSAADQGADVLLVDEMLRSGGSFCWQWAHDEPAQNEFLRLRQRVEQHAKIRLSLSTQVAGWYADHWVALVDRQRLTKLRTRSLIVASGCHEQPAVFQNNDLPGIMLGSAAQRLIQQFAVRPFHSAVVLTANSEGYRVALDLCHAGVEVAAVVDLRHDPESDLANQVSKEDIPIYKGHTILEAKPNSNGTRIRSVLISALNKDGQPVGTPTQAISCDGVAVSVGWTPVSDILYQSGTRFRYDNVIEQLVPNTLSEGVFAAGRVRGIFELEDQLQDGSCAGIAACQYLGIGNASVSERKPVTGPAHGHPYPIFPHTGKKNFVDFDEDLHLADFHNAHQEGYDNIELLKRYTTVGMGPTQGKLSNMNAVRILARLNGKSIDKTGTTTSRPFHQPVAIEHLAGRRFHPERRTPMHAWHATHHATLVHVGGGWLRPEYYNQPDRTRDQCILDEAHAVRQAVGLIDLGTLGKIYVHGPDAVPFMNRMYVGSFTRQKEGTLRYGVACDETGVIIDDGIVARLAEDRFYLSTTTTGAGTFYRELQRWAIMWKMNVVLTNMTSQWTAMNIAGPKSRDVLATVVDVDLSSASLPFSGACRAKVGGVPALLMRVGFVGELGYEIHVPAASGYHVWNELMRAGQSSDIRPFGVEAQRLLRLEKGHVIVSQDTDALTTPFEIGLEEMVNRKKEFFVGQPSLRIVGTQARQRSLVGFSFHPEYDGPLPDECHLVMHEGEIVGRVTSIAHRSTLNRPIGLAFVRPDLANPGTAIRIRTDNGQFAEGQIVSTPFYDPQGERQTI